jgi:hypothetical protein
MNSADRATRASLTPAAHPGAGKQTLHRVWRAAKLYIGFHREANGTARAEAKVWAPKDGRATIHPDPEVQECFINVLSETQEPARDVQIKLRPDTIVLRRDQGAGWNGIVVGEHWVSVQVNGIWIRINPDGSITHEKPDNVTYVEADGSVLKRTPSVEAMMSGDGIELSRRTEDSISAIQEHGVLSRGR